MDEKKVTVVAKVKAKPGLEEQVKNELLRMVELTHQEDGCIEYNLHESPEDKGLFMFYENWTSKEKLDVHLQTPHLKGFAEKAEELLAEPLDISLWVMLHQPK